VLDEVFVERAGGELVAVLIDEEDPEAEASSVIQNDEHVVKASDQRFTRNLHEVFVLLRFARSDFQADVEGDGDVLKEDVASSLDLFGVHAPCVPCRERS
jgi:hypothetical protein